MGHEAFVLEQLKKTGRQIPRFYGSEPNSGDLCFIQYFTQQMIQIGPGITAIPAHMHAGNNNFLNTLQLIKPDFFDNLLLTATAFISSREGDNTERTAITTTILHLYERTLTTALEQRNVIHA